jgi:hypothetical protein
MLNDFDLILSLMRCMRAISKSQSLYENEDTQLSQNPYFKDLFDSLEKQKAFKQKKRDE